ncbi:MAG: mannose-1-phosphate guanylyltransferase/mannose-6-phosphate isomerase [Porticoccaceae bacterium]|jgi:mannose-1-phosphate guanylyltransferase/mannose-6-phosphate isomerase
MINIVPVILSGGSGTRMWPKSRKEYPKQFLPLFGDSTMLQDTLLRLETLNAEPALIICNEAHRFLVAEQLRACDIKAAAILLEPMGKNTAPAVTLAALASPSKDSILLVLAADHVIENVAEFIQRIEQGAKLADQGKLVTFGIVPQSPEVGYGYIRAGEDVGDGACVVAEFVEKPDRETAESYLADGNYFWNSGMFMFRAGDFLDELEKFQPEILKHCELAFDKSVRDLDFTRIDAEAFAMCKGDSIDYAVMEHTENAVVLPVDIGWNDVGSWSSVWEVSEKDDMGNRFTGDVIQQDSTNNLVDSNGRLITLVGVTDLVVIDTDDALLVASRDQVQKVKEIVSKIDSRGGSEHLNHRKVMRPWGSYDSVDADESFQVKRITVNPGASLSLQKHYHRAEHWIVVSGTAEVTCGEKVYIVEKNQSTYIPLGEKHRLSNPGKIPLKLIEVQSGDYLGEDDIVRFEDNYGRTK